MIKNISNLNKVEWAYNHFAWSFVERDDLSIKMEEIPVGGMSELHHHKLSNQFFFILSGRAVVKVDSKDYELKEHEGIEIQKNQRHRIKNSGNEKLTFILVSFPKVLDTDVHR